MSQEKVEAVVRQPIAVAAHSRRHVEERLGLRFPRALAFMAQTVSRLHPGSRLRQALVRRAVQLSFEATNRGDYEAVFMLYHPEVETTTPPLFAGLGDESVIRGREERVRFQRRWNAEWGEVRFEPEEVIDLGARRVLVVGRIKGSGLGSGASFENEWANLVTLSDGRVIREQAFIDHAEALKAVGLAE
jgi:ketosteroid isomerase-like protein